MLYHILIIVGGICWLSAAIMLAAMIGAMFAPDKPKLTSRCILSAILFLPALALVPLSFAACILLFTIAFILGITVCGTRIALELIIEGVPEVDEEGNVVETPATSNTAPWV